MGNLKVIYEDEDQYVEFSVHKPPRGSTEACGHGYITQYDQPRLLDPARQALPAPNQLLLPAPPCSPPSHTSRPHHSDPVRLSDAPVRPDDSVSQLSRSGSQVPRRSHSTSSRSQASHRPQPAPLTAKNLQRSASVAGSRASGSSRTERRPSPSRAPSRGPSNALSRAASRVSHAFSRRSESSRRGSPTPADQQIHQWQSQVSSSQAPPASHASSRRSEHHHGHSHAHGHGSSRSHHHHSSDTGSDATARQRHGASSNVNRGRGMEEGDDRHLFDRLDLSSTTRQPSRSQSTHSKSNYSKAGSSTSRSRR